MSDRRIQEMLSESGWATAEMTDVADLLAPLEELVGETPAASPELAALFSGARARPAAPRGRHSAVAGVVVLALSGVGATGLSAAANTLPAALQHRVSQFSHSYLPFDLPEPPARHRHVSGLAPLPTTTERQDDPTSRSTPGRDGLDDSGRPAITRPYAQPGVQPQGQAAGQATAAPGYAAQSVAPTPSAQPTASGSPSPSDHPGKGHPQKTSGPGTSNGPTPAAGSQSPSAPSNPGNGQGKGNGQDKNNDKGPSKGGGAQPDPAPAAPAPVPPTAPEPDPSPPTLPLPSPLPDVDLPDLGGALGGN
jgi:hypothetical protein